MSRELRDRGDREIVMFRGKRVRAHKALLILLEAKG